MTEYVLKFYLKVIEKMFLKIMENLLKMMVQNWRQSVGGQAWKIPNLEANGAQHLLKKEYLSGKEKACEISFGIC